MKKFVQTHILLLFIAHCVLGKWEDGNAGVDRPGGDLPGMPITLNSTEPSSCAKLCQMRSKCKSWSFNVDFCSATNSSQPPECYLKSTVTQQHLDPCKVSLRQQ